MRRQRLEPGSGKVKAGTTIEYWASNQGATISQDKQVITEAIARFKKQTGVNVKFKVIPWSGPVHEHHDRHDERQGSRRPQHRQHVVGDAAVDGRVHPVRGQRPEGDRR